MAKILLITGNHIRHQKFSEFVKIMDKHNVVGQIVQVREQTIPSPPKYLDNDLKNLWNLHFNKREESENNYLKPDRNDDYSNNALFVHSDRDLNSNESIKYVKECNPDVALIQGVGIIRDDLYFSLPPYKINFHMGLIPYFKGSITMFWPFYFLQPTLAGCTFHVIDKLVDTGMILHQMVPVLEKGDGIHDVASKACLAGYKDIQLVIDNVENKIKNKIDPVMDKSLATKGKLFKKKDWKPEMLRVIYELFNDNIVDLYLDKKIKSPKPSLITLDNL
jgi:folate-dependent phosphoribosylglycinamide formyltransferase PurN